MMELPLILLTGNSVSEEFELTLPEDVIEGSARASVSVLGNTLNFKYKNYKVKFYDVCNASKK